MMHQLPASEYARAMPLFAAIPYQRAAVFTVLEGRQAGRVFVDHPDHPGAALIISDFCYFGGRPHKLDLEKDVVSLLPDRRNPTECIYRFCQQRTVGFYWRSPRRNRGGHA
jgi:hypothetical protein